MDELLKQAIDAYAESHRGEMIEDLRRLVRIPSVAQPGSPEPEPYGHEAARALNEGVKMAREKGMQAVCCGNYYALAQRGTGRHSIGIFSHLDVVEVDDRWTYPPFDVTEKDGWMIGRGTNDDKVAAVLGMHTAKALDELGAAKHTRLVLYMGSCEEKGMSDLERYVQEQEQPDFSMVPDFIFPVSVGEPGILKLSIEKKADFRELKKLRGGTPGARMPLDAEALYTGTDGEKMLSAAAAAENVSAEQNDGSILVRAAGRAASGFGKDDAVNAIDVLLGFLSGCGALCPEDSAELGQLAAFACGSDGSGFGIACKEPLFGALKCSCMQLEVKGGTLKLSFDIRSPGSVSPDTLLGSITERAEAAGFAVGNVMSNSGCFVPPDDPCVQLVNAAWNEVSGRQDSPRCGGGTYARKLKKAVAFGPKKMQKCPFLPEGHGMLHGPDEAMNIDTMVDALKVYLRAVIALDEHYAEESNG